MSSFYIGLAKTAQMLLASKGTPVAVRRISKTFDPVTSKEITNSTLMQDLVGVILPAKGSSSYDSMIASDLINGEQNTAIISTVGSTYQPEPLDELIAGADTWVVYGVTPIDPSNQTPVIYKLGLFKK